jgi:hypothetical protein
MFYDQLALQYQQYKVLCSTYHYTFSTSNTNNGVVTEMAYNTTPPTTLDEIVEFSRRPPALLTATQKCEGTIKVYPAVILGLVESEYVSNSQYNTAFGANPANTAFVQFCLHPATGTDTGCTLDVTIVMDIVALLPVDPGLS